MRRNPSVAGTIATGSNPPLAYTLVPALPEGLAKLPPTDAVSGRTIAGMPAAVQGSPRTLTPTTGSPRPRAARALPARPGVRAGSRRRAPGELHRPHRARPDAARAVADGQEPASRPPDQGDSVVTGRRSQAGGLSAVGASSPIRYYPYPSDVASECGIWMWEIIYYIN